MKYAHDYDASIKDEAKRVPLTLGPNQERVSCPRCGSPYVATLDPGERFDPALPGLTCDAGDCPQRS